MPPETRPQSRPLAFRRDLVVIPASDTPAGRSIDKRRIRKHAVLNLVRQHGPVSRADLSKISGFNLRTTSMLVDELVAEGLAFEQQAVEIPRGRRPTPVVLNPAAASVMGIDIGRQRTIGRLMDLGGRLIREVELQTPPIPQPRRFAEWARRVARQTIEEAGSTGLPPLCGIGVGMPAMIEKNGTNALFDRQKVAERIREELHQDYDVEILVENDARMMALGSLWFGHGREYSSFAVLKLGVGLGLGVVIEGGLVEAANGRDMELGHAPLGDLAARCYCGCMGCLDTTASGSGIERMAREMAMKETRAEDVARLAREGDPAAAEIFRRFSESLGRAIATVMNLFSLEAIILSGRVSRASDLFLDQTREVVARHALPSVQKTTALIVSDPNARLGVLGAVSNVYSHVFYAHHVDVAEVI